MVGSLEFQIAARLNEGLAEDVQLDPDQVYILGKEYFVEAYAQICEYGNTIDQFLKSDVFGISNIDCLRITRINPLYEQQLAAGVVLGPQSYDDIQKHIKDIKKSEARVERYERNSSFGRVSLLIGSCLGGSTYPSPRDYANKFPGVIHDTSTEVPYVYVQQRLTPIIQLAFDHLEPRGAQL